MEETLSILLIAAVFAAGLWKMVDGMARVGPRDSFLMVLDVRWFFAICIGLGSLAYLLIPRDDSFADRAFVALVLFPFGAMLAITLQDTGIFLGMALRASRLPDEPLGLLPDHWFDRRLMRFLRHRLWLSRLLDAVFRTQSHPRLVEQLKASGGRESPGNTGAD